MHRRWLHGLAGLILAVVPGLARAAPAGDSERAIVHPVFALHGMVASQEASATRIGLEVLEHGGNAVDAAVSVGFALAVTLPEAGNLGGGGFMLIHLAATHKTTAIDYREKAGRTRSQHVPGREGRFRPGKSQSSGLGVGVPGTVAGMAMALEKYGSGKFSLADLARPPMKLAAQGVPGRRGLYDSLQRGRGACAAIRRAGAIFLHPDGSRSGRGETLVQKDLGDTLGAIGRGGPVGFL